MTKRFQNKIVLITGAARGLGETTATLFAEEGARVIITDVAEKKGKAVVEKISSRGFSAEFSHLDVSSEAEWENVIASIIKNYRKLDILINNAGISIACPLIDMSLEDRQHVMSINLNGTFLGSKHGVRAMKEKGGVIVNVSSASGIVGSPMAAAYCASKGGVRMLTKAVALECAKADYKIRVNSIHPAAVQTPMWDTANWWPDFVKHMGSEDAAWQALAQASPMGRIATTDEIAKSILFLASDDASYMTEVSWLWMVGTRRNKF